MKKPGRDPPGKEQTGNAKDGTQSKGEQHSHSQVGLFTAVFGRGAFCDKAGNGSMDAGVGEGYSYC